MPIISTIRKLLRLDKATLSLDREFTDAVGFYLTERKELMKEEFQGCLVSDSHACNYNHDGHLLLDHPADASHA
jgi:putative methionine-R-sulfoxide reductase with GAF domain